MQLLDVSSPAMDEANKDPSVGKLRATAERWRRQQRQGHREEELEKLR